MATLKWRRAAAPVVLTLLAAAGMLTCAMPVAQAYILKKTDTCKPGQRWDTSRPVKLRVVGDSAFDYFKQRGNAPTLTDLARLDQDVKAVIALYNAIPGSKLVLEQDTGITGDSSLSTASNENWGTQTIMIGFTNEVANTSATAEAWTTGNPDDGCTRTRAHIQFRKDFYWIFGPPETTDVDGRSFTTAEQVPPAKAKTRTFLGILTHEMGHALGLEHPDDDYAVMAQSFRTWVRTKDDTLRTRLMPDDTRGILALYGTAGVTPPLDISVTNSWYKPAKASFDACTTQIAAVDAAAQALSKATGLPITGQFPAGGIFKGEYAELFIALANAQDALQACEDSKNAIQVDNCAVSSRADDWADLLSGVNAFCGVNTKGSTYPKVSDEICPGKQIQVRYTLNNHTSLREVLVKSEVWFSTDTRLNAFKGSDIKSPDVRDYTLKAATSASIGQVFRVPDTVPQEKTLYVFVRAVPHDQTTGTSLWDADVDPWNNAIMVRHGITVSQAACR
jgi:hypothetical protein